MFRNTSRRERGMVMVYVAVALIPLVGLFVLAMQWAQLTVVQAALQDYVDARAISSIQDRFGAPMGPIDLASFVPDQTDPLTPPQCGGWDHDGRSFNSGSPCRSSGGVPAHRVEHTITVPILFAPLAALVDGSPEAELTASATAFIPRRQVVLVQDISGSLGPDLSPSQNALSRVVNTMHDQDLPGDEIGIVSFGSDAIVETSMAQLTTDKSVLDSTIANLDTSAEGRRSATCTIGGISLGRDAVLPRKPEHEASPLMVIVTDGDPTTNCGFSEAPPEAAAIAEADQACEDLIDVWVIAVPSTAGSPNLEVIGQLACNEHQVISVDTAGGVEAAVADILTQIPVRIVE